MAVDLRPSSVVPCYHFITPVLSSTKAGEAEGVQGGLTKLKYEVTKGVVHYIVHTPF